MAFYECYLLPADLIDFPIGAILHENQSLGGNVASPGTSAVHWFTRAVDILEHYLLCCQSFWKDRRIGFVCVLI